VAAVSWFQMRLEESERLERLELDELAKGHARAALFESKDSEMFPAQRSREQFERFFVRYLPQCCALARLRLLSFFGDHFRNRMLVSP